MHQGGTTPDGDARSKVVLDEQIAFYRENIKWLIAHHADFAQKAKLDLATDERANAIWKLSGQALSHATALIELLDLGYTTQTWPAMRAIHEVDRLLIAVCDPEEERIARRWSSGQEVAQRDA